MSLDRTFVLISQLQVNNACMLINQNWAAMFADGAPLAVKIWEHKTQRSIEQNRLMWRWLEELSEQAWIQGRQYSDNAWHHEIKIAHLPEEDGPSKRCLKNYRKWDFTFHGERILVGSTTQLTTFGKSEYLTKMLAYGAGLGVNFSATPSEASLYR